MYENDNSMPTRGLTDYKDVQSVHVDIDSVAIAANKLQAFQCNRFEPFKINVEGHLQTCLNSKLLDSLGIKSQQPVQEFFVGGQGEFKLFVIVKSSKKLTKVGPYATKEGKLERIDNEHNWFIQNLVLKSIERLKRTTQTWQMCPKKVTPDSHQKRSITIYPTDWDDFVCLFDNTVSGDPNAPFKMNASSRYVFYRCSHGLKIRNLDFCMQHMAQDLIRDLTLIKCVQIHVGFVIEPHENNAAFVNLDNIKKLGVGSQSRYQQYYMYWNHGFFSGMSSCTLEKETKYVNSYNPSHHILDPHKSSTVYAGAVTGFCSAVPRDGSPKYGLSKTTFPADFSSKLGGYASYAQVVANKSSCRLEFVLEVTPDLLFRKTDSSEWLKCLQQRQNLQNLSRYVALPTSVTDGADSNVAQGWPNFHINCEPKTFVFLFVKKVEREILRLQLISICGNYKQYGVRMYDLANELRRLVALGKGSKPVTKNFVRTVYDVESLLRFFIEGYHPLRVDTNRLDRLLTDVDGLALLPKPNVLKIRSELLALAKLEPISLREQSFPFPRMINQIEWLFSNLPDFDRPDNKIYTFFRLLCIYSVQFCGCEIPAKTYLDPRHHLTVDFVETCKTKDLRWTTIYTAQEVTDRLLHPRTVIGQMLASCSFTEKDFENADVGAAVFNFLKSHVDCIPAFIVEGHEIVHKQYAWGQIAKKRGSNYRILQESEDSNTIQPPFIKLHMSRVIHYTLYFLSNGHI